MVIGFDGIVALILPLAALCVDLYGKIPRYPVDIRKTLPAMYS
jgi:hypothetical protein